LTSWAPSQPRNKAPTHLGPHLVFGLGPPLFSPNDCDPALFVHTYPCGWTLLILYVDDMIITSNDSEYIAFVKARLHEQFPMTDSWSSLLVFWD
jgi:hypothetical protein